MKQSFTGSGQGVEDIAPLLLSKSLRRQRWRLHTPLPGRLPSFLAFLRQRLGRVRDLFPLLWVVPVDDRRPLFVTQVAQFL